MSKEIILNTTNKNMNDKYLTMLFKQFNDAIAMDKKYKVNVYKHWDEFIEWLIERKEIIPDYKELLNMMALNYTDENTAEIGKGIHDSIITEDIKTKIITPYPHQITDKNRVIEGDLKLANPKENNILLGDICPNLDTLITQNPYSIANYKEFASMHNDNYYNTIIGVYGKIYDKDRELKKAILEGMKEKLIGDVKLDGSTIGDKYCYVISAKMFEAKHTNDREFSGYDSSEYDEYIKTDAYSRKYTR